MTITINYGMNQEPEDIRHVYSIRELPPAYGFEATELLIEWLGSDCVVKHRKIKYTDYVTITIH